MNNEANPIVLIPADVKVCETSDDIQDEQADEYVPISHAAVPAGVRQRSLKQESRFISQCYLTSELYRLLIKRDEEEIIILDSGINSTDSDTANILESSLEHRTASCMPLLVDKIVINNTHIKSISARTFVFSFFKISNFRVFSSFSVEFFTVFTPIFRKSNYTVKMDVTVKNEIV